MNLKDIIKIINQNLAPVMKRVKLTVGKCVIDSITDTTGLQTHKIVLLADEVLDEIERIQEYGFTSVPLPGCEGVAVFVGGNRGNGSIIATDDRRYRPTSLEPGDVAIYSKTGNMVKVLADGSIVIDSEKIELGQGALEKMLKGETFQTFFNNHTHVGNAGAPTSPPQSPSLPAHLSTVVKGV